jgi:hypothetical protein
MQWALGSSRDPCWEGTDEYHKDNYFPLPLLSITCFLGNWTCRWNMSCPIPNKNVPFGTVTNSILSSSRIRDSLLLGILRIL